jgi:hypothetical protein
MESIPVAATGPQNGRVRVATGHVDEPARMRSK